MCFECMVVVCFHLFEYYMHNCVHENAGIRTYQKCVVPRFVPRMLGYISICTCVKLWQLLRALSAAILCIRFSLGSLSNDDSTIFGMYTKILLHTKVTRYHLDVIFIYVFSQNNYDILKTIEYEIINFCELC